MVYLKGQKMLPVGENSFQLEQTHIRKEHNFFFTKLTPKMF